MGREIRQTVLLEAPRFAAFEAKFSNICEWEQGELSKGRYYGDGA